jgi:hypothetical protein
MTNDDFGFSSKDWRARADEARTSADSMREGVEKAMLMEMANAFDRLAEKTAQAERSKSADSD